jgi:hypothetical protein
MKHLLSLTSLVILASACASTPNSLLPDPTTIPLDTARMERFLRPGTGTIEGQAFVKTKGGDVKYATGESVILLPATDYTMQYATRLGTAAAFEPDPRLAKYARRTIAGGDGRFRFTDLPEGNYMIYTKIFWQIPGRNGLETTGSWLSDVASSISGETRQIILTR